MVRVYLLHGVGGLFLAPAVHSLEHVLAKVLLVQHDKGLSEAALPERTRHLVPLRHFGLFPFPQCMVIMVVVVMMMMMMMWRGMESG